MCSSNWAACKTATESNDRYTILYASRKKSTRVWPQWLLISWKIFVFKTSPSSVETWLQWVEKYVVCVNTKKVSCRELQMFCRGDSSVYTLCVRPERNMSLCPIWISISKSKCKYIEEIYRCLQNQLIQYFKYYRNLGLRSSFEWTVVHSLSISRVRKVLIFT